jgi:hypothetical protein
MSGILLMSVGSTYASAPVNTVAPAVTGAAGVGQTLTTTNGTWTGSPAPTFTYQWQRVTTNISGQTASTYVTQVADIGSTLRCVVTATNSLAAVSANSNSTAAVALMPGDTYQGGFFAGQISTVTPGVASFNLVIGPVASAENSSKQWKTSNTGSDPTDVIDGPANSAAMNSAAYPAAQFCEGLSIGGFSDWYMPAQNELEVCYYNLKPTTTNNSTSSGANVNSVPQRPSNYTTGTPAQTSAANFQTGGAQAFTVPGRYWVSTQQATNAAFLQGFGSGYQIYDFKTAIYFVRAVRRVAV